MPHRATQADLTRTRAIWLTGLSSLAVVSVGIVILLAILGYRTQQAVSDRMDRIAAVAQLLSSLKDAETGERGYLVTEDPAYLAPYTAAIRRLPGQYETTRAAFANTIPERRKVVEQLIARTKDKVRGLGVALRVARERGFPAAAEATREGRGRQWMEDARRITGSLISAERAEQDRELYKLGIWQTAFYAAAALLILITSVLLVSALLETMRALARTREDAEGKSVLLQEVLEASPDLIFVKDPAGRYTHANKATLEVMGRDAALGLRDADMYPQDIAGKIEADDRKAMQSAAAYSFEESIVPKGHGRTRYFLTTKVAIRDSAGALKGMLGISKDITDRKHAEEKQKLLINELNHRVKNTLAVLQSITVQTFKGAEPEKIEKFEGRLQSLSGAHNILTRHRWSGASLKEVIETSVAGLQGLELAQGPNIALKPSAALSISMILHELATNAVKYGALSVPEGRVRVRWQMQEGPGEVLRIEWREEGGPPVTRPERAGFGTKLIERSLGGDPEGSVTMDYAPTGVTCVMQLFKFSPDTEAALV